MIHIILISSSFSSTHYRKDEEAQAAEPLVSVRGKSDFFSRLLAALLLVLHAKFIHANMLCNACTHCTLHTHGKKREQ